MNMDVVKAVVAYARGREAEYGKKFRFTITTNGVVREYASAGSVTTGSTEI